MTEVFEYYAGVDGGGTHCRVRVRDAGGQLVGEATGGPGNIRLGFEVIWPNILAALDEALAQGGLDRAVLSQMSFGLGLAGITNLDTAQQTIAAGPGFGRVRATSDAHAALLGAFSGRDGAILITGTGSAAYGWVKGRALVAGGWGFEVSDDGSGASLGRESIRAALHAHDGLREETAFTRAVMAHFDGDPSAVVTWVTTARAGDYGTLAPLAISYAEQGDAVAVELVQAQARFLDRYIHRLHVLGADKVALVGGMARPFGPWLSERGKAWLAEPEQDALEGAILMARGAPDGFSQGSEARPDMRVVG